MAVQTLLFDVHRTLVDDQGFPRERIRRLIQNTGMNINPDEYYQHYDELVKTLFNWPQIHPFKKIREIHRQRLEIFYHKYHIQRDIEQDLAWLWRCMKTSQIYADVPDVLNLLSREYKIGLISNADNDDPLIEILLENRYQFDAIITSESVGIYKPDAKIFKVSLERLNCSPENTLVIGDSLVSDVLGAANAGIKCVWLNRNDQQHLAKFPKPDFEIKNLGELPAILKILH